MTPAQVTCPSCRAALALKRQPRPGVLARCPKCRDVFPVDGPTDATTPRSSLDPPETAVTSSNPPPETAVTPAGAPASAAPSGEFPFLDPPQAAGEIGRLGSFRVLDVLGKGGMGVVFRAEDTGLRRHVAVKAMLPHIAADPGARARFLREARAQAAVEHDHVAPIHLVSEDGPVPFLAMPLLKGESLVSALRANPTVRVAEAVRIAREVAAGLAAAHATGLVHRDVTPGNVWLEGDGRRVKLLDFGLARAVAEADPGDQLTRPGAVVGTPAYMSPEQARGEPLDHRTDLFSLGCVLYLLLAHRPAFMGGNVPAILVAVVTKTPPRPSSLNVLVPPGLDALVMQLLAKAPGDRPPTAAEVADRLAAVEADLRTAGGAGTSDWSARSAVAPPLRGDGQARSGVVPNGSATDAGAPLELDDADETAALPPWNRVAVWLMSTAAAATAAASAAAAAAATAAAALRLRGQSPNGLALWLVGVGAAAAGIGALVLAVVVYFIRPGSPPADIPPPAEVAKHALQPPINNSKPSPEPVPEKNGVKRPVNTPAPKRLAVEKPPVVPPIVETPPVAPPVTKAPLVVPPAVPARSASWKATTQKTLLVARRMTPDATNGGRPVWLGLGPGKGADVVADGEVVCLPGYKADLSHDSGLTVRLWGNVPELEPVSVLGVRVRFHGPEPEPKVEMPLPEVGQRVDTAITLFAGRIYLTSAKNPVRVRVWAAGEGYDLGLAPESEVVVELTRVFVPGRPFDRNKAHPIRTDVVLAVVRGSVGVEIPGARHAAVRPPKAFTWSSTAPTRLDGPRELPEYDVAPSGRPAPAKSVDRNQAEAQKALDLIATLPANEFGTKALMTQLAAEAPSPYSLFRNTTGVYGLGVLATSVKELEPVVDVLADTNRGYARRAAATALSAWLIDNPQSTAALGDRLGQMLRPAGAGAEVLRLLHGTIDPDAPNPAELDRLVGLLPHGSVAVRELALRNLIPFAHPAPDRDVELKRDVGDTTGPDYTRFVQAWRARVAEVKRRPPAKN